MTPLARFRMTLFAVPVLLGTLALSSDANAYEQLDGYPCAVIELKPGAFSYWKQSKYMKGVPLTPAIKGADWLIKDLYNAHLGPAIATKDTELGVGRGGSVSANLHYVLRKIPNHPQALYVLIDYSFTIRSKPRHSLLRAQPECYLQQAIDFVPDDPGPHFLFGLYLYRKGKFELALSEYDAGIALAPNSAEGLYNRGLTLVKLGRYEAARADAVKAYSLGYPLKGLQRMLQKKGFPLDKPAAGSEKLASEESSG